jgi:pilus assembly protein CpaE
MSIALRTCLLDLTGDPRGELRPHLETSEHLAVIDLCNSWASLQQHLQAGNIDLVAINLDVAENPRFLSVRRIAEVAPNCAILGISSDADPQTIIGAMRAGCSQFVRAPIDPADLQEAIERVRQTRLPSAVAALQIAVIGSSGGAGGTTVACNLALELTHVSTQEVALIDLNLHFGDVACAFDAAPRYSVGDVCRTDVTIDRTLLEMAMHQQTCKVALLPRPEHLADAEFVTPEGVEQLLRVLAQSYTYTVMDVPRYFSAVSLAALRAADRVLIVSQLAVPFLRNAQRIYAGLVESGVDDARIELVLNRAKTEHERITTAEVEKHFGRPVYATIPNDYKHITAARDLGHPIRAEAPNSPARRAIQALAQQLVKAHTGPSQPAPARRGLFGGLFSKK